MANLIGPDVSFYQNDDETSRKIDFLKMKSNAGYVIIRAGQNNWVDPDFAFNWIEAKKYKLPRGSYWFYDSRCDPVAQSELWIEQFDGDFGELPLFADFEKETWMPGPYTGWKNYQKFLERTKKLAITKEVGIYTGFYHWKDDVNVPLIEQEYFKQFPLWIAAYNNIAPMIPAPWTEHLFWQFTDKGNGAAYGVESNNIDLNYFNGDLILFNMRFGLDAADVRPLDAESHTSPFEGVELHRVFRFGSWCSVAVIHPAGKRFHVTPFKMRTTSQAAKELEAQLAINGGAHTPYKAIGLHVSDGKYYAPQSEYEPFCNFSDANAPSMEYYDSHITRYNALAGKRMIVENGKISANNSGAWYETHPRTLIGLDAQGRSVWATVDGRQKPYSIGMDLFQSAALMIEFGCVKATDLDGGGSTTMALNTEVINYPIDMGVVGKERSVGNHVAMFVDGIVVIPPDPGKVNMFTVIKSARFRSAPTMTTNDQGASSVVGETFESSLTVVDVNNPAITMVLHPNGKYLPMQINGVDYTTGTISEPVPPIESPIVLVVAHRADGTTQNFVPEL